MIRTPLQRASTESLRQPAAFEQPFDIMPFFEVLAVQPLDTVVLRDLVAAHVGRGDQTSQRAAKLMTELTAARWTMADVESRSEGQNTRAMDFLPVLKQIHNMIGGASVDEVVPSDHRPASVRSVAHSLTPRPASPVQEAPEVQEPAVVQASQSAEQAPEPVDTDALAADFALALSLDQSDPFADPEPVAGEPEPVIASAPVSDAPVASDIAAIIERLNPINVFSAGNFITNFVTLQTMENTRANSTPAQLIENQEYGQQTLDVCASVGDSLQSNPENAASQVLAAQLFRILGNNEEAARALAALAENPALRSAPPVLQSHAHGLHALTQAALGNFSKAVPSAELALRLNERNAFALAALGEVAYKLGDYPRAEAKIAASLAITPTLEARTTAEEMQFGRP